MSTLYSDTPVYYTRKRQRVGGITWDCTYVTERGVGGVTWGCTYVTGRGVGDVTWGCTYVTEPHEYCAFTGTLKPLTWVTRKLWQVLTSCRLRY